MIWEVPRIWEGGDCFIFGGGPSIPEQFGVPEEKRRLVMERKATPRIYQPYILEMLKDKHIIGINAAYLIGDFFDFIFFGDRRFFLENEQGLKAMGKPIVSCHHSFNGHPWVKWLSKGKPLGIESSPNKVSWNNNSGAAAISMAANAGVKRIILLGFDMTLDSEKNQHWHKHYQKVGNNPRRDVNTSFARHLSSFGTIYQDANKRGLKLINTSMNSKIKEIPKIPLKELI